MINQTLRQHGLDPSSVLTRRTLPIDKIRPLEGWHTEASYDDSLWILDEFGLGFASILVVDMGDHYQTIDGEHRVKATEIAGASEIDAYVLTKAAFDVLYPKYGENELSDWASEQYWV